MTHGACQLWGGFWKKKQHIPCRRWNSEDGIVSRLRERLSRNRSLIPGRSERFTSFPERPDGLWGRTSFLFNGYRGFSPRGVSGRDVKLTAHFHLVPRLRMRGATPPLPDISSWGIEDDTIRLYFYSMYCVLVLWFLPAIISNNKIKSVTETEIGTV